MKVEEFVQHDFLKVSPFASISEIKDLLCQNEAIVIIEDDQYFGIITQDDIHNKPGHLAFECLSVKTEITTHHTIDSALRIMEYENTDVLPIFKNNKPVGLVYKKDLLNYKNLIQGDIPDYS